MAENPFEVLEDLINRRFDELKSELKAIETRQAIQAEGLTDIEGAAAMLNVSTRQIRNIAKKAGGFQIVYIGRSPKIRISELKAYMERLEGKPDGRMRHGAKLTASSLDNRSGARRRKTG